MLIGITGTIGAGKGVIVEYLVDRGYRHYSARSFFTKLLEEQGLEVTRPNMTALANGLREEYGGTYIIGQMIELAIQQGGNAVVESIRAIDEVNILHSNDGVLIGVTANQNLRYQRIVGRGSSLDHISFEQFVFDEHVEGSSPDPAKSNVFTCMAHADKIFLNEESIENLYHQLDKYFHSLNQNTKLIQ